VAHPRRLFQCVALAAVISAAGPCWAVQIIPHYVDAAGQSWLTDPARKAVIEQAVVEWETRVKDEGTFDVTFTFASSGSFLGQWQGGGSFTVGTDVYPWTAGLTHTVTFNAAYLTGNPSMWWDPTPATGGDVPTNRWDVLSTVRHELGHALGFTTGLYVNNFGTPGQVDRWKSHVSGSTFDPGGLNVSLASVNNLSHLLDSGATQGDLMVPSLVNGVRRPIGMTDMQMLALSQGYTMDFFPGDFNNDGVVNLADVDMLYAALGSASPPANPRLDLIRDHAINAVDARALICNIIGTSLADTNLDHVVDIMDLGAMANKYGHAGAFEDGDADANGIVNIMDLGILANDYGKQFGSAVGSSSLPEPASAILLGAGAALLPAMRRRARD
jgi:hypothetical protein